MLQNESIHEEVRIQQEIQSLYKNYEASDYLVANHWHPHLEILYLLKGCLLLTVGDQEFSLNPGSLAVINSHEIHSTRCSGINKVIMLQIPYELLSASIPGFDHIRFVNLPSCKEGVLPEENPTRLLLALNDIYSQKEDGWQLQFRSLLYRLLYILYHAGHETVSLSVKIRSERNLTRLQAITDYVKVHYKEPITLAEAAKVSGFNPEYFCRFFKKHMGVTFLTYIQTVRLSHVYEELISTDYTITEILERHGVGNYRLFMKLFKETYGCTPLQKRKQLAQSS